MRASGLAFALLLLGVVNSLPQYGGVGEDQQTQVEQLQQTQQQTQVSQGDQHQQTQQQQGGADGEYWWREENPFGVQGPGDVVVAPIDGSTFTPQQSSECALTFGCVPWQYCSGGVFNYVADITLTDVIPDDVVATSSLCGQVGNLCCRIPDEILAAQEQAQTSRGDVPTVDIPVPVQTAVADIPVPAQTAVAGGGYGGTSGPVTDATRCEWGYECVPDFQCTNGEINTSGAGLLDLRIPVKLTSCSNPEYPAVNAVCCKDPSRTPPDYLTCSGPAECVPRHLCNADGTHNTDGAGVIDVRITLSPCHLDNVYYEDGVCCSPKKAEPLVTCNAGDLCLTADQCSAPGVTYDVVPGTSYDGLAPRSCYLGGGGGPEGICCAVPTPVTTCPGNNVCWSETHCPTPGATRSDGRYTSCYLSGGEGVEGICCEAPPVVEVCPPESVCRPQAQCTNHDTNPGPLNYIGKYTECQLSGGDIGICCARPKPVDTCPVGHLCADSCTTQTAPDVLALDVFNEYLRCNKNKQTTYADGDSIGNCCKPEARLVDTCPGRSVCIPEILCQGELLKDAEEDIFLKYTPDASYAQCPLSGGLQIPGVCCQDPTPPAATQCGVRNYVLDTRIQSGLEKNETGFAEFPWQAIIFFSNYTFKCGASLISDRLLLTGAHCVDGFAPGDLRIRLGEWQVNTYDEPLKYEDVNIAKIHIHPEFNPTNVHQNLAVLELETPVEFKYHINAICLPTPDQNFVGSRCIATGWGKDAFTGSYQERLKLVELPVVANDVCQANLRKTRLGKFFILDESFMCAGGEEGKDACTGDGGGPLSCPDPTTGRYHLAGITSWGIGCGAKDVPGVYASVQALDGWLSTVLGGDQQQQQTGYGK